MQFESQFMEVIATRARGGQHTTAFMEVKARMPGVSEDQQRSFRWDQPSSSHSERQKSCCSSDDIKSGYQLCLRRVRGIVNLGGISRSEPLRNSKGSIRFRTSFCQNCLCKFQTRSRVLMSTAVRRASQSRKPAWKRHRNLNATHQ
jgi:hypothetical protein